MKARSSTARTFYNVADALGPPGEDGSSDTPGVDLLPYVERRLARGGVRSARRLRRVLAAIEWLPVLGLRARRSFSVLPRAHRRELLEGWRSSRLGARRQAFLWLEDLIQASRADAGLGRGVVPDQPRERLGPTGRSTRSRRDSP